MASRREPWQLVVATILSAQCTDKRVNEVTPGLFRRYPKPDDLATAEPAELEELIRSTGFFRSKAKSLMGCACAVVEPTRAQPASIAADGQPTGPRLARPHTPGRRANRYDCEPSDWALPVAHAV